MYMNSVMPIYEGLFLKKLSIKSFFKSAINCGKLHYTKKNHLYPNYA